jgi:hypothetical protein
MRICASILGVIRTSRLTAAGAVLLETPSARVESLPPCA